jgi:Family of unknown function (DUF6037)
MTLKLNGLQPLYKNMRSQNIERYKFCYEVNKAIFDVFFFLDESPFILLFGAKGESFSFEISVKAGFVIDDTLSGTTYKKLCKFLGLKYDPNNPFSPKKFFTEFNSQIPTQIGLSSIVESSDLASYLEIVEEAHKTYFFGWKDNEKCGESVSEANLDKTRKLLGKTTYERCRSKNISSRWTHKKGNCSGGNDRMRVSGDFLTRSSTD